MIIYTKHEHKIKWRLNFDNFRCCVVFFKFQMSVFRLNAFPRTSILYFILIYL